MVRFYYFLFGIFSFTLYKISQNSSHNNRLLSIAKTRLDLLVCEGFRQVHAQSSGLLYCTVLKWVFMYWIQYRRCLIPIGLNVDSHNHCWPLASVWSNTQISMIECLQRVFARSMDDMKAHTFVWIWSRLSLGRALDETENP